MGCLRIGTRRCVLHSAEYDAEVYLAPPKSQEEPEDEYEGDNEYGEDDEYGYSDEEADEDGEGDEGENVPDENANLDANEGQQEDKHSDLASAFSNMRLKGEKADPQTFLSHEVPDEPEDEEGLTTDSEDGEWESPEVRQKKVRLAMKLNTWT